MKTLIITLTPFPSIEYIYSIEDLIPNKSMPSKSVSLNILSKGIYCSQMIKILQEEPIMITSLGGFGGKSIKYYLDKARIKSDIVWTNNETPHQVSILSEKNGSTYTLLSGEETLGEKEFSKLTYKLNQHIKKISTMVLSGGVNNPYKVEAFVEWINLASNHNIKTVLSTGCSDVWQAIKSKKPYAVMFTKQQLKNLGYAYHDPRQIIQDMTPLLHQGIHYICIYLKNEGAFILAKNKHCYIHATSQLLNPNNTAASGAFLGALAIGVNRQYEQEKIGKLALAAALAADDNIMHEICVRREVEYRYKKTKIEIIPPYQD